VLSSEQTFLNTNGELGYKIECLEGALGLLLTNRQYQKSQKISDTKNFIERFPSLVYAKRYYGNFFQDGARISYAI
jgi:hypothetical protein